MVLSCKETSFKKLCKSSCVERCTIQFFKSSVSSEYSSFSDQQLNLHYLLKCHNHPYMLSRSVLVAPADSKGVSDAVWAQNDSEQMKSYYKNTLFCFCIIINTYFLLASPTCGIIFPKILHSQN